MSRCCTCSAMALVATTLRLTKARWTTTRRWDESLYDALGADLLALTAFTEISPGVDTYYQRALGGSRTPGALIEGFAFTL